MALLQEAMANVMCLAKQTSRVQDCRQTDMEGCTHMETRRKADWLAGVPPISAARG